MSVDDEQPWKMEPVLKKCPEILIMWTFLNRSLQLFATLILSADNLEFVHGYP